MIHHPRTHEIFLRCTIAVVLTSLTFPAWVQGSDSVAVENAKPGTTAWKIDLGNYSLDAVQPPAGPPTTDCTVGPCFSGGPNL